MSQSEFTFTIDNIKRMNHSNLFLNDDDNYLTVIMLILVTSIICTSVCSFTLLNFILFRFQCSSPAKRKKKFINNINKNIPSYVDCTNSDSSSNEPYERWKWRNIFVSLIHSSISGLMALILTYDYICKKIQYPMPELETLSEYNVHRFLLCFSIGYFLYDSLLSLTKIGIYPDRTEIIVHHLITTLTLVLAVYPVMTSDEQKYQLLPFCTFGLTIEMSNIFIHIRSLGNISNYWQFYRTLFKLNSILAVGSIILFRFYPLIKICLAIGENYLEPNRLPPAISDWLLLFIMFALLSFIIISIVILIRIVQEDFSNELIVLKHWLTLFPYNRSCSSIRTKPKNRFLSNGHRAKIIKKWQ